MFPELVLQDRTPNRNSPDLGGKNNQRDDVKFCLLLQRMGTYPSECPAEGEEGERMSILGDWKGCQYGKVCGGLHATRATLYEYSDPDGNSNGGVVLESTEPSHPGNEHYPSNPQLRSVDFEDCNACATEDDCGASNSSHTKCVNACGQRRCALAALEVHSKIICRLISAAPACKNEETHS